MEHPIFNLATKTKRENIFLFDGLSVGWMVWMWSDKITKTHKNTEEKILDLEICTNLNISLKHFHKHYFHLDYLIKILFKTQKTNNLFFVKFLSAQTMFVQLFLWQFYKFHLRSFFTVQISGFYRLFSGFHRSGATVQVQNYVFTLFSYFFT